MFGSVLIAERHTPLLLLHNDGITTPSRATALCLGAGPLTWTSDRRHVTSGPSEGLLLNMRRPGELTSAQGFACLIVMTTHTALVAPLAGLPDAQALAGSTALKAVRRLATGLLAVDLKLSGAQSQLVACAMLELLAAAILPLSPDAVGVAQRRELSLFDRAVAYVDAHLANRLDAETLCEALYCSRSALYRALGAAGGVIELVNERRLATIQRCLLDPADRRPIGAIASANGFTDPSRFSRSFKRSYGITAAELRRRKRVDIIKGAQ